jgi:hypothetical protein
MPGRFAQMRVRVESHARAGAPEDPADLDDVETDVDDQMAGERVAQIVEAHPLAVAIEACAGGGAAKHTLGHVVVEKRRAVAGRDHVVRTAVAQELELWGPALIACWRRARRRGSGFARAGAAQVRARRLSRRR